MEIIIHKGNTIYIYYAYILYIVINYDYIALHIYILHPIHYTSYTQIHSKHHILSILESDFMRLESLLEPGHCAHLVEQLSGEVERVGGLEGLNRVQL